jgi:fatty-acyl-CoA synthase
VRADGFEISSKTALLLIVPMFLANAWGVPYSAPMVGAKMVLPGQHMDGESLFTLMRDEGISFSMAVPTIWLMLFQYLDSNPDADLCALSLSAAGVGGAAPPIAMIERFRKAGVEMVQGWGVDIKIVDDEGKRQPWDGTASGHLYVRGLWIASGYYRQEGGDVLDSEGFFPTGDIGTIDEDGYLQLVDRSKDVIKSGGEWISSIELENTAASHPQVAEAAVIGIAHPKWQERPLLIAVLRKDATIGEDELMEFLGQHVAKWWLPDEIMFVDELPHTATGKLLKTKLRGKHSVLLPLASA